MAMRHWSAAPLPARRPPAQARHLRRRAGFINEDQVFGIEFRLEFEPRLPASQDVRPLLLACVCCFF